MFEEFITKLQDFQNHLKKLPAGLFSDFRREPFRIVVVGSVGVGKSSVIERIISENSFKLPKGKDACTRRPVKINIPISIKSPLEKEVKIATWEPLVLNNEGSIEFIDLPGLTEISRSDQPSEYPEMTRYLFDTYVKLADIILLCLPADVDFVNSDALRRLRQLEIDDERIIGVVSKMDLLEEPEKIDLEIACTFGSVILIRNAPNLEINQSIDVVSRKENDFFKSFKTKYLTGIDVLKSEILRILTIKFEREKNEAITRLLMDEKRLRNRLAYLHDPNIALNLLLDYIKRVKLELETSACSESRTSRLYWLFWNLIPNAFESIDPLDGVNRKQLRIILQNSQGLNTSLIGIDSAFKVLLKGQLRISERIIGEVLLTILKELRDILLVKSFEVDSENGAENDGLLDIESVDEFYDVRSVSDAESEMKEFEYHNEVDDELRLVPGLSKMINESVSSLLNSCYETTQKYLNDYCAMQGEMVFCRDSQYLEAFKQYDQVLLRRSRMSGLIGLSELSAISSSSFGDYRSEPITASVPMSRIDSESLDSVDLKPQKREDIGFIRELLGLLFPSSGGNKMKRVEYRPRAYKPILLEKKANTNYTNNTEHMCLLDKSNTSHEELMLKLLEIYLNSYHRQLSDFLPKCINFHLIQQVLKGLPTVLLQQSSSSSKTAEKEGRRVVGRELERIERILKIIEEIKSL